jgi:hypothetical protein
VLFPQLTSPESVSSNDTVTMRNEEALYWSFNGPPVIQLMRTERSHDASCYPWEEVNWILLLPYQKTSEESRPTINLHLRVFELCYSSSAACPPFILTGHPFFWTLLLCCWLSVTASDAKGYSTHICYAVCWLAFMLHVCLHTKLCPNFSMGTHKLLLFVLG